MIDINIKDLHKKYMDEEVLGEVSEDSLEDILKFIGGANTYHPIRCSDGKSRLLMFENKIKE